MNTLAWIAVAFAVVVVLVIWREAQKGEACAGACNQGRTPCPDNCPRLKAHQPPPLKKP